MEQKLKTVPEWISRIREQLSVSYAGLGMKEKSDYNRNIYLDILEDTRQDKELESRYQALEKEAGQLNVVLSLVIVGFVLVSLFFWFFNKRSKDRNRVHLHRLQLMLDICQKITASIPADAQTEEEIIDSIRMAVCPELEKLFGVKDIRIDNGQLVFPRRMSKDEQAMVRVITPYIQWAIDNGMASISLGDERRRLEKQRYIYGAAHRREQTAKSDKESMYGYCQRNSPVHRPYHQRSAETDSKRIHQRGADKGGEIPVYRRVGYYHQRIQ